MSSRRFAIGALCVVVSSCSQPPSETETSSAESGQDTEAITPAPMQIEGMNLYAFDTSPTAGETRKPTLWLRAASSSMVDDAVWNIEDIVAVMYDEEGNPIEMVADSGRYDQSLGDGKERAVLHMAKLTMGDTTMSMPIFEWDNATNEAFSSGPVAIAIDGAESVAETLRLYPRDRAFVLTNGHGTFPFRKGLQ